MDREEEKINAVGEGYPLQVVQILLLFALHLPVQNLDAVEAKPGGVLYDFINRVFYLVEMPIGVGRNAYADGLRRFCGLCRLGDSVVGNERGARHRAGLEQVASGKIHIASSKESSTKWRQGTLRSG